VEEKTAAATWRAQHGIFPLLPAHAVSSATADNGGEFAFHHKLADMMRVPTYFCGQYSSLQRGTNTSSATSNAICPGVPALMMSPKEELTEYVKEINDRPRRVLGWWTPAQVFQEL
jgi:IS30 family transposase